MIENLRKLFKLREYAYGHISFLLMLKAFKRKKIYLAFGCATLALIFEGLGVSILVPLLSYIHVDGDIEKFKESSKLSFYVYKSITFFGLNINLIILSIISALFIFLRQLLNYYNQVLVQKISSGVHKQVNIKMFSSLMSSSQKFITDLNTGKFINATDIEPGMMAMAMKAYFTFYTNVLTILIYSTVLLLTSFIPTLIGILILTTLVLLTGGKLAVITKKIAEKNVSLRAMYRDLITERFLGWKTVKTFDTLNKEVDKLSGVQDKIYYHTVKMTKVSAMTQFIFVTLATVITLATLNIFIEFLDFDAAKILVFGIVFMRLTPTFKVFQHNLGRLVELLPSYEFCYKIYKNSDTYSISDSGNLDKITLKNKINLKNIYFKYYSNENFILKNITLKIKIGEINAIIGPSGAGKSTLVDLLSKIITPSKGNVYFDDHNIRDIKDNYLRELISYIPQDPFLFKDTILNNILYGASSKVSNKKVWEVLKLVKMDKYIRSLPKNLNTNVGLLGNTISGGQRQRLILARAILKGSSIIILDEATSAVDAKTDQLIQKSLKEIKNKDKKITIIFISHRLSSLLFANHIIEIDNGKIKFEGTLNSFRRKSSEINI